MAFVLDKGKYFSKGEAFLLGEGLLATRTVYSGGRNLPGHRHQNAYLSVLVKGGYRETGPGFDDLITSGGFFFHPGGEVHRDVFGKSGATVLNFETPPGFWVRKGLTELTPGKRVAGKDSRIFDLAVRVSREMSNPERFGLLAMEGLALQILEVFLRLTARPKAAPEVLTAVDAYLNENFRENFSLEGLGQKFGLSRGWLARTFRQVYGETVSERVTRLRLNEAIRLMNETAKPLAEIAQAAGFYDQSHFSRVFRKKRGMPPGRFRNI